MDIKDIGKDLTQAAKDAAKEFADQAKGNTKQVRQAIENTLQDILVDMANGKSLERIVEDHDTRSRALAAAALFKMSEQQSKAASAIHDLMEKILWIIVRSAITAL